MVKALGSFFILMFVATWAVGIGFFIEALFTYPVIALVITGLSFLICWMLQE